MSLKNKRIVPINYTARDFDSIRNELKEYAKKYFPSTYKDFSEVAFGSLLFDTVAYTGDILSFYLDFQVNESFMDSAVEYNNVVRHAKAKGYKFKGNPTSWGTETFYVMVPANSEALGPDPKYYPVLQKGTSLATPGGNAFLLNEDVHFDNPLNEIVVGRVDDTTGIPTHYAVKAFGQVISGELARESVSVGDFAKFKRLELEAEDIAEILSVFDSEGHEYYEVEHLSQDVIYRPIVNMKETRDQVSAILKPFVVPRRFVVDREQFKTYLQFGYGSDSELEDESVADPAKVVLDIYGKDYITDESFDPTNLLSTEKFGIAPANTVLTVIYRVNTSENVNAGVRSISKVVTPVMKFDDITVLDRDQINFVYSSIECENEEPIVGDISIPSSDELKIRAEGAFTTQGRAVTELDYKSLAYNMPPKFGAIKRVAIRRDNGSFRRNLNLYVMSEDANGHFVEPNDDLKKNLRTWLSRNKMLSDTIDILNAKIVNFGIEFEVIAKIDRNKFDVVSACVAALEDKFEDALDISENLSISELYTVLNRVESVSDTVSVRYVLKAGGEYSDIRINLNDLKSADGRYIEIPDNCIAELKFPSLDIKGAIK